MRLLRKLLPALALLGLLFHGSIHAAGAPESVAVVVNAESWASTTIANEYIHLRGIPASNVIYISGVKSFDGASVNEFREQILIPVMKTIESRGLSGQIDCIAYSADFPSGIDVNPDVGGKKLPQVITPVASINGLTFLHSLVLAKDTTYLDLNCNRYVRRIIRPRHDAEWTPDERDHYEKVLHLMMDDPAKEREKKDKESKAPPKDDATKKKEAEVDGALREKNLQEALRIHLEMKATHPDSELLLYNLACCYALCGKADESFAALKDAVECGWWDSDHTRQDDDLTILRKRDDFKALVESIKTPNFDVYPTQGFRSSMAWSPKGEIVAGEDGRRYMLSVMLAYTSGRANSVREALNYLRRSAGADGTRPKGTIYFPMNGDVRSTTRHFAFKTTAQKLKELGVEAQLLDGVLPNSKADVAGAMVGSAGFDWKSSGSTILPGAIVEHLTSYGGMMQEDAGQTPFTEFLRYGAAGSSGTVTEPFAIQAKFPFSFIHVHYVRGCTLAEAFYQSVSGPYQLLIVGDPLCRPWAKIPKVSFDALNAKDTLNGTVTLRGSAETDGNIRGYELYVDGLRVETWKSDAKTIEFKLDTTKYSEGNHELGVVVTLADDVMTQGHGIVPVLFANTALKTSFSYNGAKELRWDQPLELEVAVAGANSIEILHNGRVVGKIDGEKGKATVDLRVVGEGPARLQPVGYFDAEHTRSFVCEPVDVVVVPPPALGGGENSKEKLSNGIALTVAEKTVIVDKPGANLLANSGVKKDVPFAIDANFRVPDEDVYQFQIRGGANVKSIRVDDVAQDWPRGKVWWFVPVALKAGLHRLKIEGLGSDDSNLEIRFGGPGAQRINGGRFQHAGQ